MVSYYFLQSLLMGVKKSFTLGFLLPKWWVIFYLTIIIISSWHS
jgi:hypothetical protein